VQSKCSDGFNKCQSACSAYYQSCGTTQPTGDCATCINQNLGSCVQQNCLSQCNSPNPGTDSGTTTTGGHTCADVKACCPKFPAGQAQDGCNTVANSGSASACDQYYTAASSICGT
jgi:hypothetical protein